MLMKMWSNRNAHLLLTRMQNATVTLEDSLAISYQKHERSMQREQEVSRCEKDKVALPNAGGESRR